MKVQKSWKGKIHKMTYDKFNLDLMKTRSALFLDGWLKFNEEKWGYKPERVLYQIPGKDLPKLEGVFYLNKKGHVVMPPRNPYLPLQFTPTPTDQPYRLYTQWLEVSELLADDLKKRGFRGTIAFPPGFFDARAFQWLGFDVGIRYTFVGSLPIDEALIDPSTKQKIKKAHRFGYSWLQSKDWEAINYCLKKTGEAKDFSHLVSSKELEYACNILGKESFRGYLCKSEKGEPVSGQIKLFLAEGVSIDWSAGTDRNHIKNGVNQLLYKDSFEDMAGNGGKIFDLCGANIESVANAKATWGFPLVPYITISNDTMPRKIYRAFVPKKLKPLVRSLFKGV